MPSDLKGHQYPSIAYCRPAHPVRQVTVSPGPPRKAGLAARTHRRVCVCSRQASLDPFKGKQAEENNGEKEQKGVFTVTDKEIRFSLCISWVHLIDSGCHWWKQTVLASNMPTICSPRPLSWTFLELRRKLPGCSSRQVTGPYVLIHCVGQGSSLEGDSAGPTFH